MNVFTIHLKLNPKSTKNLFDKLKYALIVFFFQFFQQTTLAQWEYVGTIHARSVRAITYLDARTNVITGGVQGVNMIARYVNQGTDIDQYFDTDSTKLRYCDVSFPGRTNIGYVVGWDGAIIKTNTTGNQWFFLKRYLPSSVTDRDFNGVYFINTNEGYVVGGKSNDSTQTILKTTNGGNSWTVQKDMAGSLLNSVYFISNTTGIAIGNGNTILKTTNGGTSWNPITVAGISGIRSYRKIIFKDANTGFIVGGNEENTIATILKTTNSGDTWTVIKDAAGEVLNGIGFKNNLEGYAVGNKGVILSTNNGGDTWSNFTLPEEINDNVRNLRAVNFFNNYSGAFGGDDGKYFVFKETLPTAPSVTTENAIVNLDNTVQLSGTVNTHNNKAMVTVEYGKNNNLGTILKVSADSISNNTFQNVSVTTPILDGGVYYYRFRASGEGGDAVGEIKLFSIGVPIVQIGSAIIDPTNKAKLTGTVNPNGSTASISFEYGTTPALGTIVNATGTFSGNSIQAVSVVTPPLAEGMYYFNIKGTSSAGTHTSDVRQFYVGPNPIPNFDFEFWHTDSMAMPDSWMAMSARPTASYDGSIAIKVDGIDNAKAGGFGLALLGTAGDNGPSGGFPFGARPDSIVGYFNYALAPDAPAVFAIILKKDGEMIAMSPNYIGDSTHYNSGGNFERIAFPIVYPDATVVPDSAIIALLSFDVFFGGGGGMNPDNVLIADNLSFTGANVPIPNGDFEHWTHLTVTDPISWVTRNDAFNPPTTIKTTDAQHGKYAIILKNDASKGQFAELRSGVPNNDGQWRPSFAINQRYTTFQGFYKFYPEGIDTIQIYAQLFKNGEQIASTQYAISNPTTEYAEFIAPIQYQHPDEMVTPDSAFINVQMYKFDNSTHQSIFSNSILYLDNLAFNSYNIEDTLTITKIKNSFNAPPIKIYPNPASDYIAVELPKNEKVLSLLVFDLSGKTYPLSNIDNAYKEIEMMNVAELASGTYIVRIQTDQQVYTNKFIKQ